MSLTSLFLILKGSGRSGNKGHSGRPGQRGGSRSVSFDSSLENDEIKQFKQGRDIEPKMLDISDKMRKRYSEQYDHWMAQGSKDADIIKSLKSANK